VQLTYFTIIVEIKNYFQNMLVCFQNQLFTMSKNLEIGLTLLLSIFLKDQCCILPK